MEYGTFDILQDEEVRQGLKKFSDWPTYPQLYVNSELIGGLDIVKVRYCNKVSEGQCISVICSCQYWDTEFGIHAKKRLIARQLSPVSYDLLGKGVSVWTPIYHYESDKASSRVTLLAQV